MKKIILFSLMAFIAGRIVAQNIQSIPIGTVAPSTETKMKNIDGKEVSIKDAMKKNGVLVMFSCNTCPFVIKNQARTKAIAAYAVQKSFGVIIINSNEANRADDDSYEAMKTYAKTEGYTFSYVVDKDSKVADAFGATRTPETFLLDAKGKLIYKGAIDDNAEDADNVKRQHLKLAITEQVEGKEITVKQSNSKGCTIKRS